MNGVWNMKTFVPKQADIDRKWWLIDAQGRTLGRVATQIAVLLTGKYKPNYVPYQDVGDFVVVINVDKIVLTGKKWRMKIYRHHTGYPGGLKEITAEKLHKQHPERLMELAVKGMLPKNRLRKVYVRKLKVYAGNEHPHQAQKPQIFRGFSEAPGVREENS